MTHSLCEMLQRKWTAETLDKILTNGDNLYTIHTVELMLGDFKQECPN